MSDMKIITNCPLCEERSLHVIGQEDYKIQQCIACGYVTNDNYKGKMKWGLADMIDIPSEDRKDYPIEGKEGQFYTRKYDTDKATIYPNFYEALDFVNNRAKDTENKNG